MKTNRIIRKTKGRKSDGRRRGVALITVLTIMSLATILVMTFFTLAQNEHNAASSYSEGLQAQQVAEEAVNMVIRQIRKATSNAGREKGETLAWASQPGAIRTWNMLGLFEKGFKLYSDERMVVEDEGDLTRADYADLLDWDQRPWEFVDLNEPVIRGDRVYYPIVDPVAKDEPEWPTTMGGYLQDDRGIEGFSFREGEIAPGPMELVVLARDRVVMPMPAKWIYQLNDGTLGYLVADKEFVSMHLGGSEATEDNPIVARFAFWTDDESCKLNPNVHAGGAAWGTPMAGGDIDRNLGRFQPAQHEWQRYPGHPATTHLAPVLAPGITDITYQRDNMEMIFKLVPRVVGGGSWSGTTKIDFRDKKQRNGLIADKDRLYPSLDEFIMKPDRDPNRFPEPGSRGEAQKTRYMQDHIERMKFFLTVVSRAPEVTIFNTPRVSIWPTYYDKEIGFRETKPGRPGHHTAFDKLIRFCAEVGSPPGRPDERYRYHFQRANEDSSTYDYDNIKRNQELFAYLEKLTRTEIPGAGGSFEDKYPEDERLQLLTEVFDYIRSTNLHDDTVYQDDWEDAFLKENRKDNLTYTNGRRVDGKDRLMHKGHGQVTPIRTKFKGTESKGMGRFYTLMEMGVQVICCADGGKGTKGGPAVDINPGTKKYQVPGFDEEPESSNDWSNYPPLPTDVKNGQESTYPKWLKDLQPEDKKIALDETRWNWHLAWLDQKYEGKMPDSLWDRLYLSAIPSGDAPHVTRLGTKEKLVQAALLFQMFTPSLGWVPINPDMEIDIQIEGMQFTNADGTPVKFGWGEASGDRGVDLSQPLGKTPGDNAWASARISRTGEGTSWTGGDRTYGGIKPCTYFMRTSRRDSTKQHQQAGRSTPLDREWYEDTELDYHRYPYITKPFKIVPEPGSPAGTNPRVKLSDGEVTMKIYASGDGGVETEQTSSKSRVELVQELHIPFPPMDTIAPTLAKGREAYINEFGAVQHKKLRAGTYWSLGRDGINPHSVVDTISDNDADGRRWGRMGRVWGLHDFLRRGIREDETNLPSDPLPGGDVLYSVGVRHGDARMVAARPLVVAGDNLFEPHHYWQYPQKSPRHPYVYTAHNFASTPGDRGYGSSGHKDYNLVPKGLANYHSRRRPYAMQLDTAEHAQRYGDFDNGMGNSIDGPYINKPDEGNTHSLFNRTDRSAMGTGMWDAARDYGDFPYFVRDYWHEPGTPAYFSPNRIISSPGMFGSLPVGTTMPWKPDVGPNQTGQPWRTLLFRPNVIGQGSDGLYDSHPGAVEPKDHYFLDMFWMPVVEPYAISEPLSTGGKVNLNYQILPYTNITRSTALRGVFKSEYMLVIPNKYARDYKIGYGTGVGYHWRDKPYGGNLQTKSLRAVILEDDTLKQFEDRFERDEIFRTASAICDIHLVPEELSKRMGIGGANGSIGMITPSVEDMESGAFWMKNAVVGDNGRERPYSNIYARLTTKSNTYKVHFRAQVVKQAKQVDRDFSKWDERFDTMVAEYRGSTIVERYVEPNDPEIPDYTQISRDSSATGIPLTTIDEYYKFRVVNPTRFAP